MSGITPQPDPPLTLEQEERVAQLIEADLHEIDMALLSNSDARWRKIARVVGSTMGQMPDEFQGIPDIFYAQRLRRLVSEGQLESQGYLEYMQFCEVRLPTSEVTVA